MLETFFLSFVVVVFAILGMAVGVLFGRRPLREGGCGDIDATGVCGVCGSDPRAGQPRIPYEGTLS